MNRKLADDILQGLLMAAVVVAALPIPDLAFANAELGQSVDVVTTNIEYIPNLISGCFYIGGTVLLGAGLLKLKAHAENPTQVPLGHGVGRIVTGAGLLAIPAFGTWAINTVANTATQGPQFMPMSPISLGG